MTKYTARICWNTNGWRFPSGDAAHLETGTYAVDTGFGHEEWLFNFAWLIDGFHYAFLQPISKSFSSFSGKTIEILAYSINPSGQRVYVGEISGCEVLTELQAKEAVEAYKKRGWIKSMAEQVSAVGGDASCITAEREARHLLNIRFRPEHAELFDPLVLADRHHQVWNRNRYTLAEADEKVVAEWRRKGSTAPPAIKTITRRGIPGITYDPLHERLQAQLMTLLQERYGRKKVVREKDNVDITIFDDSSTILIEIKSNPIARSAIREALGQLLEYAYYYPGASERNLELLMIAPGKLDETAARYIDRLRTHFKLPIRYLSFSEGDGLPEFFRKGRPVAAAV